jgi:hypothetical protein
MVVPGAATARAAAAMLSVMACVVFGLMSSSFMVGLASGRCRFGAYCIQKVHHAGPDQVLVATPWCITMGTGIRSGRVFLHDQTDPARAKPACWRSAARWQG